MNYYSEKVYGGKYRCVWHLAAYLERHPETKEAVVYCRASRRSSRKKMRKQVASILRELTELGLGAATIFKRVESGYRDPEFSDGDMLTGAIRYARKRKLILVAESVSRFIRSKDYHSVTNFNAQPNEEEWDYLKEMASGVVLATIHPPWFGSGKERSVQTKRGTVRENKKAVRSKLAEVLELRKDHSLSEVARITGLTKQTVWRWSTGYPKWVRVVVNGRKSMKSMIG